MNGKGITQSGGALLAAPPADSIAHIGMEPVEGTSLMEVLTFVTWTFCLAVGLLGFVLHYSRPPRPVKQPEPVKMEKLFVQLSKQPAVPLESMRPPGSAGPSPSAPSDEMAPPPIPVAEPSPAIAFALPVEGATRVVPFNQATYARPARPSPVVQHLTYGVGEGQQPAPEYPAEAIAQHQEGSVVVRFVVGENGMVTSAEAAQPCPWPLLNESAVRTIRRLWRFTAGNVREYEISIHFQLTSQ
ncbi:MAG TPA: TonB family protein [Verrucomicrobiae bacterium]|nr:TonB family protein [Verrucomicrobiae bacterium]